MHIAFCINDAYVPYITVTMKSIIVNHPDLDINFYILTDYISGEKRKILDEVVKGTSNVHYDILYVKDKRVAQLKIGSWTIYTWYRVFLPQLLPIEVKKVLYLDADTLVVGDIRDLFKSEMKNIAIAGCLDPQSFQKETFVRCGYNSLKRYVCAGVLMMNLDYWRKYNLTDVIIQYAIENKNTIKFPDQDSINNVCKDNKIVLPIRYGIMDCFYFNNWNYNSYFKEELHESLTHPVIVHYAANLPWIKEYDNRLFHDEWRIYNKMLKYPAKREYMTKGFAFVKMIVWNFFHQANNRQITKEDVLKIIYDS